MNPIKNVSKETIQFWQAFFRSRKDLNQIIASILTKFGFSAKTRKALSWEFLYGGYRKICLRIRVSRQKTILCLFWPQKSIDKKKIIESLKIESEIAQKGVFKTRRWLQARKLLKIRIGKYWFWTTLSTSISGKAVFPYQPYHIFSAGKALSSLHEAFLKKDGRTLLHLDFARGNILFNKRGKVCGILDFEEASWGEPEKDIACSLSFLIIDAKNLSKEEVKKRFLEGYEKSGKIKPNLKKVRSYLQYYLKLREKEMAKNQKSPPRFLREAKKIWASYLKKVKDKVVSVEDLAKIRKQQKDKKIVFTLGAWELVHWGHLSFLQEAKEKGEILVVGVATNESRRRLKSPPHPLISEMTRAETLVYFPFVDRVVICDEDNALPVLRELKPDVFFTAKMDWKEGLRTKKEEELAKKFKGKIIKRAHLKPNISSSNLVKKVALIKIRQAVQPIWQRGLDSPLLRPQLSQREKLDQLILFEE